MHQENCPINHGICANCYWNKDNVCVLKMKLDAQTLDPLPHEEQDKIVPGDAGYDYRRFDK